MNRLIKWVAVTLLLLCGLSNALASTYVSIATGSWSTTSTWALLQTGTITTSTASTTVTGVGTGFSSASLSGKVLYNSNGTALGTVSSVASTTSLTLTANATSTNAGIAFYIPATSTVSSADTVTINSPNTISASSSATATNVTVNSGATLSPGSKTVTLSGNLTNNGTITGTGSLILSGNSAILSGTGTFSSSLKLLTYGTAPVVAVGSNLIFAGTTVIYAGCSSTSCSSSRLHSTSVLTINGTLSSTQSAGTSWLKLYATSTVVSSTGVISASNSTITYGNSAATLTNNGLVTVDKITQNSTSNSWTQGASSKLTLYLTSTVGKLYASATSNTVTYNGTSSTDVPITSLNPTNTYYNLAGAAVSCPTAFTILGTSPCAVGVYGVTKFPTSCTSVAGANVAWGSPSNATATDASYTTASLSTGKTTTNFLQCTGYNFAIPTGATINGIMVNVTRHESSSYATIKDADMRLVKNVNGLATIQSTDRSTTTTYTTTDFAESHGTSTDLWGGTWAVSDINSVNFGAAFASYITNPSSTSRTVYVDSMPISVFYTPAPTTPDHVVISAPTTGSTCSPASVTITLHTVNHALMTGWNGTISLSTSDNVGSWGLVTGSGTFSAGSGGSASYTFSPTESTITLGLTHSANGTISVGVTSGVTNLLAKTPASELANSITYNTSVGSFEVVSNATGTPVKVTNMNQVAGQTSSSYYLYAMSSTCQAVFNNVTQPIQFATQCNNPTSCSSAVMTITPCPSTGCTGTGTGVALQKGISNGSAPVSSNYTNVSMNFNSSSRAPFTLNYPDAGQITMYMYYSSGTTIASGSDPFTVKPAGFVLNGIKCTTASSTSCGAGALAQSTPGNNPAATDATGGAFIKAGNPFTMSVTALTASGATKANAGTAINCATTAMDCAPNFGQEVIPESILLTTSLVAPVGGNQGSMSGKFGTFSSGIATGTAFSWNEVGIVTLTPSLLSGNYLSMDATNTGLGNVTGTTSGNIGRFYPDHFFVVPDQNNPIDNRADYCFQGVWISDGLTSCDGFTYMGESMNVNFALSAQSLTGTNTQNYIYSSTAANNFGPLNLSCTNIANCPLYASLNFAALDTVTSTNLTSRLESPNLSSANGSSFSNGFANISVPGDIKRNTFVDGNYTSLNIGISPKDADGVTIGTIYTAAQCSGGLQVSDGVTPCMIGFALSGTNYGLIGNTEVRYGRMKIASATGSQLLALPTSFTAQYWNSTVGDFVTANDDAATIMLGTDIALGNWQLSGNNWTTAAFSSPNSAATSLTSTNGVWGVTLSKPSTTFSSRASVDLTISSNALYFSYLPYVTGRATFGVYTGNMNFMYMKENY
jgi:hypothetical protein